MSEGEGEKEQKQFDRFMCYCETGVDKLVQAIKDAEEKIPQVIVLFLPETGSVRRGRRGVPAILKTALIPPKPGTEPRFNQANVFAPSHESWHAVDFVGEQARLALHTMWDAPREYRSRAEPRTLQP